VPAAFQELSHVNLPAHRRPDADASVTAPLLHALQALRTNEQRLRLAMDAASLISFEWDIRRDEVRRFHSLLDTLPPTMSDAPQCFADMRELVHPEDRALFEARVRAALVHPQGRYESEFRLRLPDGRVIWLQDLGRVERDDAGRPLRLLGMSQDITARKYTEMRLAEQTALLDTLAAQAPLGMAFVDPEFRFVRINDKLAAMNGISVAEHLGRPVAQVLPQLWPVLEGPYRRALAGEALEDEVCGQTAAAPGVTRCWATSYYPVRVGTRTLGVGVVVQDVTQRRQAEQALRDADRRKDAFLATLAHELRNPLAPVRNALEVLKRADHDAALTARALGTMERQTAHMVRLIDDLLDVSRISRDHLELRRERVRLDAVIDAAVETCRPLLLDRRHALALALPASPLWLHADPVRLSQVFGNLLANACRYTEPGGRIRVEAQALGTRAVRVRVSDSGLGIPPAMLERVFDLFTQVESAQGRAAGGLGIGLSLVKRLVELHGGSVAAHSAGLGQGSDFTIELPLLAEQSLPGDAPAAEGTIPLFPGHGAPSVTPFGPIPAEAASADLAMLNLPDFPPLSDSASEDHLSGEAAPQGRRILIVDDNADSADSLAMLLQLGGHEAHTAYDGLQALELASRLQPEVLLLDLGLPGLDGCELCRRIRQQPWSARSLLIAVTGWGQAADKQRSQDAGFDGHLVKPVDLQALEKLIAGGAPAA
jgi:PAS domain S-box-containing protein